MTRPRVVAVGDNVVDCYEQLGTMYPGGNCVNVSVFARRFGAWTAYLGQVAADAAGRHIEGALSEEGVSTGLLRVVEGGRTASCLIGVRGGERVFLEADPGVSVFDPSAAELEALAGADAVHIGATSSLDRWVPIVATRARVSYDFAVFRDDDHIGRIAPHTYLATFSGGDLDDEGVHLLADRAITAGARWALVTRGPAGAILRGGAHTWRAPAAPTELVDTLGAGDTFLARTLVGLLRGENPDAVLAAAAAAAADTCRTHGAFGYPAPIRAASADRPERASSPHDEQEQGEHV